MSTKKSILALLEMNRGQSISGEHIAKKLNISRNAVWKAVKELEKDGYQINATTSKGYCLCDNNDILSVQGIIPFLSKNVISDKIFVYSSLESTNKTAKEMALSEAEHGTVIIADGQTAGRGRYGRGFFSPSGDGIYMSIILHPSKLSFNTPTLVTSFAAVAVCEAIESISEKTPKIKWVNDIFVEEKKICGILTEAVTDYESGIAQWIVVGIGINFRNSTIDFPEELRGIAGAVFSDEKPSTTRNHLAGDIINRVLASEKSDNEKEMLNEYKKRLMMLGERISIISTKSPYEAIALDIDDAGHLIVKKDDGQILTLSSGEISIRSK
jgi:BirA family biotin operon repressor/biotin-[acetyl-CoA-carboxylase] ligase